MTDSALLTTSPTADAAGPAWSLERALATVGEGVDVESTTRPLLEALEELTGLSTTYLTHIDWEAASQSVVFANSGEIELPEGISIDWEHTLCRRALEDETYLVDDVPERWGDNALASAIGVQSFASFPVTMPDGEVWGTLCGVSPERIDVDVTAANLLRVFARLIADAVSRDRERLASEARAAAAEERLRERATFLAMAEHACKTPLAVIVGWAELLRRDGIDAQTVREGLDAIASGADRLSLQIHELLDEAGAQAIAAELDVRPLDLPTLLRTLAVDLQRLSDDHRLVLEAPESLAVTTDARAVRIVVEHLVENAVTYSPDGGEVTVRVTTGDDGRVRISIRDRGIGLPEDVDVFAPFTRGDSGIPGTGLGLHVVASLVEALGGEVSAHRRRPGSELEVVLGT